MRVTPSLDTLGSFEICNPAVDSFIQTDPVVLFTGTDYLVGWADEKYGPSSYYHPFVARVSTAGVVLDSGIRVSTSSASEYRPNLADDGTRSFVTWSGSGQGCFGRFVNRDGVPEGSVVTIATGTASGPAAAFGDSCYLVAWHSGAYPSLELYAGLFSRAGDPVGGTIAVAAGPGCHRWPAVIHDGENFLVVWQTGENNLPSTIYGQFIGDDGSIIGTRFAICGNEPQQRWWPTVAASGSNFLVAWEQGASARDVWGNVDLPVTGVEETASAEVRPPNPATIVRGVLRIDRELSASSRQLELLDASGRTVLTRPLDRPTAGPLFVDVSRLTPGVYFVRGQGPSGQGFEGPSRRVVIQR